MKWNPRMKKKKRRGKLFLLLNMDLDLTSALFGLFLNRSACVDMSTAHILEFVWLKDTFIRHNIERMKKSTNCIARARYYYYQLHRRTVG